MVVCLLAARSVYGGRDATDAFATYHRRAFPHQRMATYAVEAPAASDGKTVRAAGCR